jgi:hypothetical protein
MRRLLLGFTMAVLIAAACLVGSPAGAQTGTLTFQPPTVVAGGGKLFVNGSCEPNTSGFVVSHAFANQPSGTEFAGVPAIAISTSNTGTFGIGLTIDPNVKAGAYPVSLRCGGGLAASATLTVLSALPRTGAPDRPLAVVGATLLALGFAFMIGARQRIARPRAEL